MKIYIKAFLVMLGLLVIACKPRTEHTIVQGYIRTHGSETTHEGIEIELNGEGAGVTLLDKTVSNADGWFQLEGDFDKSKSHYLFTLDNPEKHFAFDTKGYNHLQVKSGGVQSVDINFDPYCWVNIHFKNINPCNQNDVLRFTGNHSNSEAIYGALVDAYYLFQIAGNRELLFSYGINKCGVGENFLDTIGYVSAFDTVDFEVFY
jgi:hypothetical protein